MRDRSAQHVVGQSFSALIQWPDRSSTAFTSPRIVRPRPGKAGYEPLLRLGVAHCSNLSESRSMW